MGLFSFAKLVYNGKKQKKGRNHGTGVISYGKMTDLALAKKTLQEAGYTCVLCNGGKIHTSTQRGVKPLVLWLVSGENFSGFSAADKVVGKATAFLYVRLGVKAVYASVISRSALAVLQENGIYAEYDSLAENIINRQGDGICPFEAAVLNVRDGEAAYKEIRRKMDELGIFL